MALSGFATSVKPKGLALLYKSYKNYDIKCRKKLTK